MKLAGPLTDGAGSLIVLDATDLDAARRIADADPYVTGGVFASLILIFSCRCSRPRRVPRHDSQRTDLLVYARRRKRLLEKLGNGVLFIAGPSEAIYANDVHYRYRPDTNIRFLTGFEEPASLLLGGSGNERGLTLFVRKRDKEPRRGRPARGARGARRTLRRERGLPGRGARPKLPERLEAASGWSTRSGSTPTAMRPCKAVAKAKGAARRGKRFADGGSPTPRPSSAKRVCQGAERPSSTRCGGP